MSTGDEALRTEEVAQPDEGALALASCRQQGKMATVRIPLPTRVVLAWSVATMFVATDHGKDVAAGQKNKRGDGGLVLREVRLAFNEGLRSRCGRR